MSTPQITVLDAGGQYCHLIARKIRDLGVYADVKPSETPASELTGRKGIIISGGPDSVYEAGSPQIDPQILSADSAVLGICYGQQLMTHVLGGGVQKGEKGEYGFARFHGRPHALFANLNGADLQVWMNHRDQVQTPPEGFDVIGGTSTCAVAAIAHRTRPLMAVQFHPEVAHTEQGQPDPGELRFRRLRLREGLGSQGSHRTHRERDSRHCRATATCFSSSAAAWIPPWPTRFACARSEPDRVFGIYVDTGLMREGETAYVRRLFEQLGARDFRVEEAEAEFLKALEGVTDPETKRHIIGEQFVAVQERILSTGHFLDGRWILGQGTIYPDTIESGGTAKADVIKTHHNRVAGIQKLIETGRIIEPLGVVLQG